MFGPLWKYTITHNKLRLWSFELVCEKCGMTLVHINPAQICGVWFTPDGLTQIALSNGDCHLVNETQTDFFERLQAQ